MLAIPTEIRTLLKLRPKNFTTGAILKSKTQLAYCNEPLRVILLKYDTVKTATAQNLKEYLQTSLTIAYLIHGTFSCVQ